MNLIIRQAKIIDRKSQHHNKTADIKIENGIIAEIGSRIEDAGNFDVLELENLHISQGWFDSSVSLGEPGFEDRETISNGLAAAARSGFAAIAMQPNCIPVLDSQSGISFVKSKSAASAADLFPIGALTKASEGKDMAELFDMKNAGAVAFGDYNKSLADGNLLKIALQYVQDFDGLVIAYSQDSGIKGSGVANEGPVSTRLGLKGIPALAEELQISRNLFILEYTGGKLHIPTISTARSASLVKEAKARGLNVTCSAAVHNLVLTDEKLNGFDTRFKVTPPLRAESDREALVEAVKEGVIDMITSDHSPIDIEQKKMEFDLAKNGTIGLESAFGALMTVLPLEIIIEKFLSGRKIFGIGSHTIEEGSQASLSLFNPEGRWIFDKQHILSKSKNAIFLKHELKGRAYGIINNSCLVLNK
ncbi:MAG TPA: dihydroorotase [Flavobacterium sp.]|nr:dihydroorotase [Flavobacterium sp.]